VLESGLTFISSDSTFSISTILKSLLFVSPPDSLGIITTFKFLNDIALLSNVLFLFSAAFCLSNLSKNFCLFPNK